MELGPTDIAAIVAGSQFTAGYLDAASKDAWEKSKALVRQAVASDLADNIRRVMERVVHRSPAGPGMRPGDLHYALDQVKYVDDEIVQELWADLISQSINGAANGGALRWAGDQLRYMTGPEAMAISLVAESVRCNRPAVLRVTASRPQPVLDALEEAIAALCARGLLRSGDAGFSASMSPEAFAGLRRVVEQNRQFGDVFRESLFDADVVPPLQRGESIERLVARSFRANLDRYCNPGTEHGALIRFLPRDGWSRLKEGEWVSERTYDHDYREYALYTPARCFDLSATGVRLAKLVSPRPTPQVSEHCDVTATFNATIVWATKNELPAQ